MTGPAKIDSSALDAPPITVSLSVSTNSEKVSMVVFSSPTTFNCAISLLVTRPVTGLITWLPMNRSPLELRPE